MPEEPDDLKEFEYKKYKSIEDYNKTVEGTNYIHSLYLKAVNHPIRREILEIVNKEKKISKKDLLKILRNNDTVNDEGVFKYNMDYLIKAFCIETTHDEENSEIYYEITQSGKVVDYFE